MSAPSKDGIYIVPKGHYALASPATSQIDPTVWKDAKEWDPSRWHDKEGIASQALKMDADENGEKIDYGYGAVSRGTESPYQPFGAGKHRCIGEQVCSLTCSFFFLADILISSSLRISNWARSLLLLFVGWNCASTKFQNTIIM